MLAHSAMGYMSFLPPLEPSGYAAVSYSSMLGPSPSLIIHPRAHPAASSTAAWTSTLTNYQPTKFFQPHNPSRMVPHPSKPMVGHLLMRQSHLPPPPHFVVHHHHIFHEQPMVKKPTLTQAIVRPITTSSSSTSTTTSTTTTTTTTTTTPRPSTTSTQKTQLERKLVAEEEEEGSGDGPFSREVDENTRGWEFQIKNKDSSKNVEESLEFGHDYRRFHLGYP
jgi:hypothetical protein